MNGFTRSALESIAVDGLRALVELLGEDPDCQTLEAGPRNYIAEVQRIADRPTLDVTQLLTAEPVELVDVTTPAGLAALCAGGVLEIPASHIDAAAPVMAGPVPWSAICRSHLMPFGGVSWVAHSPGPHGYPPAPWREGEIMRRRALAWRVPARALAIYAAHMAGGLSAPDGVAVRTAEMLGVHLGGDGAACRVRVLRPCPGRHRDVDMDTVTHGTGVYADPEYHPAGEVTTQEKRRREFLGFVRSGTVQGVPAEMCSAAAVAGRPV